MYILLRIFVTIAADFLTRFSIVFTAIMVTSDLHHSSNAPSKKFFYLLAAAIAFAALYSKRKEYYHPL